MTRSSPRRRARNESGVVAIMFALLAVVLFGIAALAVDLGNAMNRRQLTQNAADFAALAGADGLPETTVTVQEVADYLNANATPSDGAEECNPDAGESVTTAMLTDGDEVNGEVSFPLSTRVRVVSPAARVQYGLASAMGFESTCVQGTAVARIASGVLGIAPFYATDSCSQGAQVLKSDAGGPSIPFSVPTLANDAETNSSTLSSVNPNPSPNQIPLALPSGPAGPQITLTGTNLGTTKVDKIGFFSSDQSAPSMADPLTSPAQTATKVSVLVPNDVASYQDVWYVRVRDKTTGTWSTRDAARPLLVGDATLSCDPESSSGNFGSIDYPWGGSDLADLERSIKDGMRPPMTLTRWPGAPLPGENACHTHSLGVISTDTVSRENTNCVQTVTGLKAMPAHDGFLKNPSGRLLVDTSPACQAVGRPVRGARNENADVLSCYLADDFLKLSDAVGYTGEDPLFTPDIWTSPRFLLVPKLQADPSGTKYMPITGFVPAFITDQPSGASRTSLLVSDATDNGLVIEHPNKLRAIRAFFFSLDALPTPPDGVELQDYMGSGRKIVTLVE